MTDDFPLPACLRDPKTFEAKLKVAVEAFVQQHGRAETQPERAGMLVALGRAEDGSLLAKLALGTLFGFNEDWPLATRNGAREVFGLPPLP